MKELFFIVSVSYNVNSQVISVEGVSYADKVSYYICYNEDNESSLDLSIGFDNNGRALSVKYKGMNSSMDLIFIKQENENPAKFTPLGTKIMPRSATWVSRIDSFFVDTWIYIRTSINKSTRVTSIELSFFC